MPDLDDAAPGWDSIDAAIAPVVGTNRPEHFGTGTGLPDQDGLWGVSAYRLEHCWFLVTYGLSELFGKVSDDPLVSGWGEELTMRTASSEAVPGWAVRLLARLGELVFERSTPFMPGGRLELPDAGAAVPPAVCWVPDRDLGSIETVHGSVAFVQTVGVSLEDLERMRLTSTDAVVSDLRQTDPFLLWPRS